MSTSIQARNTYFLLIGEKRITFYISESVFEIECRRNIANEAEDTCLIEVVNSKTHNAVRVFEQEITQFVCGEIMICFAWSVFAKRRGVCILHMININA